MPKSHQQESNGPLDLRSDKPRSQQKSNTPWDMELDLPKYTEQDMHNAIRLEREAAVKSLKRKIEETVQCSVCKEVPRQGHIKQCQAWLPDGYSQIFRIVCEWPFGLLDYGSATLRCKI